MARVNGFKRLASAAAACCVFLLSGCSAAVRLPKETNVADLEVIAVLGIDKIPGEGGGVAVTAAGTNPTSEKDGREPLVITTEQTGLSKAMQALEGITKKHVYFGHMGYYIAGEDIMREGMSGFIDYLTRDPSARMSTKLFVTRGCGARELIGKTASKDNYIADVLLSYERESSDHELIEVAKLSEVLQDALETGAALVPALSLAPNSKERGVQEPEEGPVADGKAAGAENKTEEANGSSPAEEEKSGKGEAGGIEEDGVTLCFAGYGVVRDGKLTGYIGEDDARFVKIIKKGFFAIVLESRTEGGLVSLRAESGSVRVTPVFSDAGNLKKLRLDISMSSSLSETDGKAALISDGEVDRLRLSQDEEIKRGCERLIARSQELNADFLGLGRLARLSAPLEFKKMKTPFEEIFPGLDIEVRVVSKIVRTESAHQSLGREVGG